jgi:hypothetical protein
VLTLSLPLKPYARFYIVYCSAARACSDSLPCGEEMTARFYWNWS